MIQSISSGLSVEALPPRALALMVLGKLANITLFSAAVRDAKPAVRRQISPHVLRYVCGQLGMDAARRSLMLIGGRVEAGSNCNLVPDRSVFTVDRRLNPEENLEKGRQALFRVFDEARREGVKLDVEVLQEGRPCGYARVAATVLSHSNRSNLNDSWWPNHFGT